jgi:hypothetical protein
LFFPIARAKSTAKTCYTNAKHTTQPKSTETLAVKQQHNNPTTQHHNNTTTALTTDANRWIHGIQNNPVYALAQKFGVETMHTNYTNLEYYSPNGSIVSNLLIDGLVQDFQNLPIPAFICLSTRVRRALSFSLSLSMSLLFQEKHISILSTHSS